MRFALMLVGAGLLSLASCSENRTERFASDTHETESTNNTTAAHSNADSSDAHHERQHHHDATSSNDSVQLDIQPVKIGEKVPDFEVTIDGKARKLSDLQKNQKLTKDGTLVLTYWCSFCYSCRNVEHPLDELAKQYQGKVGVIALDASSGETTDKLSSFAAEHGLSLPIALDARGKSLDIFGVSVTTTTLVIDSQGILRYRGSFLSGDSKLAEEALRAVLAGEEIPEPETRQMG